MRRQEFDEDPVRLEDVIRDDGADHYREHAADVRAWFADGEGEDPGEE